MLLKKEALHLSNISFLSGGKKVFVRSSSDWIQMTVLSAAFCQSVTGATAEKKQVPRRSHLTSRVRTDYLAAAKRKDGWCVKKKGNIFQESLSYVQLSIC